MVLKRIGRAGIHLCRSDSWYYKERILVNNDMGRRIEDCIFGDVPIWRKEEGEVNNEE